MKDTSHISSKTIQETPLGKSYSKRTFTASFVADPELWSRFKEDCAVRGVSICYVLETLMEGWLQAQKVNATIIQPVNMTINMQHVVQRPRRVTTYTGTAQIHCCVDDCIMEASIKMEKQTGTRSMMYLYTCLDHRVYFERRHWRVI